MRQKVVIILQAYMRGMLVRNRWRVNPRGVVTALKVRAHREERGAGKWWWRCWLVGVGTGNMRAMVCFKAAESWCINLSSCRVHRIDLPPHGDLGIPLSPLMGIGNGCKGGRARTLPRLPSPL